LNNFLLLGAVHTGATWQIPLNCPYTATMWPFCQIIYYYDCSLT